MNPLVSDVIDSLSRRIRDVNNTAHARALILELLDRVQVAINVHQGYVIQSQTLTTTPAVAIYEIESALPLLVSVTGMVYEGRDIDEFGEWEDLWKVNPRWVYGPGGPEPQGYATIGDTLLVIHPVPTRSYQVTVFGIIRTPELLSESQNMEFRPEDTDLVKEAVFGLLLLRQKDLDTAVEQANRIGTALQLKQISQNDRLEAEV